MQNKHNLNEIFTESRKMPHLSDEYQSVPLIEVVAPLLSNGWEIFSSKVNRVNRPDRVGFQKHMLTLVRTADIPTFTIDRTEISTLNFFNSHDGKSAYRALLGFFRMVCANGLIRGNTFADFRIRHNGRREKVVTDLNNLVNVLPDRVNESIELKNQLKGKILSTEQVHDFSAAALEIRGVQALDENILRVNSIRRRDDSNNDAWSVFNRIQENVVRGGVKLITLVDDQNFPGVKVRKFRRLKEIKSVSTLQEVNTKLFSAIEQIAKVGG
jgi:hypothetical protein